MKQRRNNVQVLYCESQAVPYLSGKYTLLPERMVPSKVLDRGVSEFGESLRVAAVLLTGEESRCEGFKRTSVIEIGLP